MSAILPPEPVDIHVGLRLRDRRKHMGISQEALAKAGGVTFQQIQKYERGRNRVSASMLYALSRALFVAPAYFFEGLPENLGAENADERAMREFASSGDGREMIRLAIQLRGPLLDATLLMMREQVKAGMGRRRAA